MSRLDTGVPSARAGVPWEPEQQGLQGPGVMEGILRQGTWPGPAPV